MKRIIAGVAFASVAAPMLHEDLRTATHRALPGLRDASRIAPDMFGIAHNRGVSHVAARIGP